MVARLRGATPIDIHGLWQFKGRSHKVAWDAIEDVTQWLGFYNQRDYLYHLERLHELIFDRATY